MGAQQSKVRITTPKTTCCFPSYNNESDLFETVKQIENCHLQALSVATWIGTAVGAPCTPVGTVAFSAATILFTFLIYRVSENSLTADAKEGKCKNNGKESRTLEGALIDSKVSAAIAKKSVCELQAKICVINNRYLRLLSKIPVDDRRLEVVPAIQTCEEVLQLFHDPMHVFRLNPLVSTPYVVTFAGIFVTIAELSIVLIPSYKGPLVGEINLLNETLTSYKTACIQTRMENIKFRRNQPESMLNVVANGIPEMNYCMEDICLRGRTNLEAKEKTKIPKPDEDDEDMIYQDANEAIAAYRKELEVEYDKFFKPAFEAISKFSAFQKHACRGGCTEEHILA